MRAKSKVWTGWSGLTVSELVPPVSATLSLPPCFGLPVDAELVVVVGELLLPQAAKRPPAVTARPALSASRRDTGCGMVDLPLIPARMS